MISKTLGNITLSPSPLHLVITALGTDRSGIVNTITRHVSQCGCNIEDSRLALLGGEFTFVMLLSGSPMAIGLIESTLPLKGAELDLLLVMKRTPSGVTPARHDGLWLEVEIPDSPRIIERFTALLANHQLPIAELITRTLPADPPLLSIRLKAHSKDSCGLGHLEPEFQQLCSDLNAQGTFRTYGLQPEELQSLELPRHSSENSLDSK